MLRTSAAKRFSDDQLLNSPITRVPNYVNGTNLIKTEESFIGSNGLSVYFRYLRNLGPYLAMIILTGIVLTHGVSIYANAWLSAWSVHPKSNEPETRALYLSVYAALGGLQGLTLFIASSVTAYGTLQSARLLHNKMLNTTLRLPMSFFDTTPLGRIANR